MVNVLGTSVDIPMVSGKWYGKVSLCFKRGILGTENWKVITIAYCKSVLTYQGFKCRSRKSILAKLSRKPDNMLEIKHPIQGLWEYSLSHHAILTKMQCSAFWAS